jgi:hypothetical protein
MKLRFFAVTVRLIFLTAWLIPLMCMGQEKQVSLQFVCFPISSDPQPVSLLVGEGKVISVELPSNILSPVYKVPALGSWVLGKAAEDAEGEFVFDSYGQTPSTGSDTQMILVIRKGKEDKDGFEMVSFDSGTKGFGGGKYIFLNGARVDIAGDAGGTQFALKPQKHMLIAPTPSETKGDRKYLYITLYFRKGEEATPFYESTWRLSDKARTLVFFHHDPNTGQLRTHTIRDYLP